MPDSQVAQAKETAREAGLSRGERRAPKSQAALEKETLQGSRTV